LTITIIWSELAVAQMERMPARAGKALLEAVGHLKFFPEIAPPVRQEGYEAYRELNQAGYRLVYCYFAEENLVRIYCVQHQRRLLPSVEYIEYQRF
jgi:mRNA-degrading endonuclease RelE of RelBE toxin-antitoxin system